MGEEDEKGAEVRARTPGYTYTLTYTLGVYIPCIEDKDGRNGSRRGGTEAREGGITPKHPSGVCKILGSERWWLWWPSSAGTHSHPLG